MYIPKNSWLLAKHTLTLLHEKLGKRHNTVAQNYHEILHFLSSPEVLSHSVFPIGVVETHSDLSTTVKTKSISLSRHLTLARHGKRYSTNKLFGYLDDSGMEREREGRKMIRLEMCRYGSLTTIGFCRQIQTHMQHMNHSTHSTHTCSSSSCFPLGCVCSRRRSRPRLVASWLQRTSCCLHYGHRPDPCCTKSNNNTMSSITHFSINNAPPSAPPPTHPHQINTDLHPTREPDRELLKGTRENTDITVWVHYRVEAKISSATHKFPLIHSLMSFESGSPS